MAVFRGMDVSSWQGTINYEAAKRDGIQFVMIRAAYGLTRDSHFIENIEGAQRAEVDRGIYLYSLASTPQQAQAEADFAVNSVRNFELTYPIAYDLESSSRTAGLTNAQRSDLVVAFCERIEELGYYAMLYSNLYWLEQRLDYARISPYDIWLAQWADRPTFQHPFGMWQYTSTGLVAGVNSRVDLDEARKDYPRIIRQAGLNKLDSSVPLPPAQPEPPEPEYRDYVVQPGDTLWGIAEKELGSGTRYLEIVELNHLQGDVIYPGQILRLPLR